MMDVKDSVLVESRDGITRVTLNRPQARNAFDVRMVTGLCDIFEHLAADPKVRGVILSGSGPVFCAGVDLNWMAGGASESERVKDAELLMRMLRAMDGCPAPVVGRIQGAAFGGGLGLVSLCDIVVASDDARFALREVRVGLVPAVIAPFFLRKVGLSQFQRFALTGEPFTAVVAKEIGLVHEVVAASELDAAVDEMTEQVRQAAPLATRATKALLRRLPALAEDEARAACIESNARARGSEEAQEGMRAFVEKRPPSWVRPPSRKGKGKVP